MSPSVQTSSVASQELTASPSEPELVARTTPPRFEGNLVNPEIRDVNLNPMNAPTDANRALSVETSLPLDDDLISKIIDLLSLVGRYNDMAAAKCQETRFRARLSEGKTFRIRSPEPRIESLRECKGPAEIRQLRRGITSSITHLQNKIQNLRLDQATLDLLKEELPSEGITILDSLQLPEENSEFLIREHIEIDSTFEGVMLESGV